MNSIYTIGVVCAFALTSCLPPQVHSQEIVSYREMCDASAAVALGSDHFVVANDERNKLRIYTRGEPDPVGSLDLSTFLGTKEDKESDLEGAAAIGKRIYWLSSHGRTSAGEVQKRRYRFFATKVRPGRPPSLKGVGQPYTNLLNDLVTAKKLKKLKLTNAATLAAEAPDGLNIEGLAARPDGTLLIGFRNPIPDGSALLIPLENPRGVVNGKKARFGSPIRLDLGGRGIRSIELVGSSYLVVAGSHDDKDTFALYRWTGKPGDAPNIMQGVDFKNLRPEALFAIPQTNLVQILSDDGGVKMGGVACKDREESDQSFRSIIIKP